MPTTYPSSLDAFPNPGAATLEDAAGFYHDEQHANANDAIEMLQAKLGISETSPQDAPVANAVLQSLANGRSKWAPISAGLITPGATWRFIQRATAVSGTTAALTFNAIPQVYESLVLQWNIRQAIGGGSSVQRVGLQIGFTPTGLASTAAYHTQRLVSVGATTTSAEELTGTSFHAGQAPQSATPANRYAHGTIMLPNYAKTTDFKQMHSLGGTINAASANTTSGYYQWSHYGEYAGTSGAIQCLELTIATFYMADTSTAVLWGVPAQ